MERRTGASRPEMSVRKRDPMEVYQLAVPDKIFQNRKIIRAVIILRIRAYRLLNKLIQRHWGLIRYRVQMTCLLKIRENWMISKKNTQFHDPEFWVEIIQ